MNETLRYKNYISTIHFSADDDVFHGKVIGVNDLITFEGNSVKKIKKSFKIKKHKEKALDKRNHPEILIKE